MNTLSTQFDSSLRQRIEEEIGQIAQNLAGGCALDHAAYLREVGRVQGMRDVLELCDEILTKLSQ